jgi:hypothetical protein
MEDAVEDVEAISLYLDLEPGTRADIEIVARAALAFSAAIKELTYILDPALEVRVELVSGSDGSLSLNSLIRAIKQHPTLSKNALKAGVIAVLAYFARAGLEDARTFGVGELIRAMTGVGATSHISEEDAKQITDMVTRALEAKIAEQHIEGVYRALDRDPAVKGVGATVEPGQRPANIVPRSEFPVRGGTIRTIDIRADKRVVRGPQRLVLISPVLVPSPTRVWRFQSSLGKVSAQMKDLRFLERLLTGQERIPMRANIELDVILETSEEKIDGVWIPQSRVILEVIHVDQPKVQTSLDLFSSPAIESDDEDN